MRQHLDALRRDGYVVVPDFVGADHVSAVQDAAAAQFSDPSRADSKGLAFRVFPYERDELNALALDERLIDFAQEYFDGQPPFLTQSVMRATYPHPGSADQELHRDYTDNGLLVPSDDPRFGQLAILIYLTDVTADHAPTHIVSRTVSDDRPLVPRTRSRHGDAALYDAEQPVIGTAGTAIMYTFSTFHRGSRYNAPDGWRLAMHLVLRPAGCEWMSFMAFGTSFERESAMRCMVTASPRQRTALGVPPPGDPYWTKATVDGVRLRYPGIDMAPYEAALG